MEKFSIPTAHLMQVIWYSREHTFSPLVNDLWAVSVALNLLWSCTEGVDRVFVADVRVFYIEVMSRDAV